MSGHKAFHSSWLARSSPAEREEEERATHDMHGYMIITGHAGFELDYICGTKSSNGKDGDGTNMPYVQPQTLKKDMFINNLDPIHNRHGEEKTDKDRSRGRRGRGRRTTTKTKQDA